VAIDQTHNPQGAPGLQVGRDGRHDRKFLPVPMGGNQYTLQLVQNSLCLDSPNESTKSGAQVGLEQVHLARFTTLVLRPQWDGTVGIFNGNDGLCLDIAYEREDAYAPVVQGTCAGHTSQRWRLVRAESTACEAAHCGATRAEPRHRPVSARSCANRSGSARCGK
jgi:Ricin-type beta-trefoil lectin domain-like